MHRVLFFVFLIMVPFSAYGADLACSITVPDSALTLLQQRFGTDSGPATQAQVEDRIRLRVEQQVRGLIKEKIEADARKVVDRFQTGDSQRQQTIRQGIDQLLR